MGSDITPGSNHGTISPWQVPALAAILAVAGGFLEGLILLGQRLGGRFIWAPIEVVWMAPLAYLIWYLGLSVLVLALVIPFRGRVSFEVVTVVFSCWASFGVVAMLLDARLHPYAVLVLALGIGLQVGKFLAARRWLRQNTVRLAAAMVALLMVVAATMMYGIPWLAGRVTGSPPEPRPGAPNVLFIIWDTVRAESLSLYGNRQPTTPELEQLAREGVVFDRVMAPSPWTLPSHGSYFTGYPAHLMEADFDVPLSDEHPTLAEAFRQAGYLTGAFVANVRYVSRESGLLRGFDHRSDYGISQAQLWLSPYIAQAYRQRRRSRNHTRWYARKAARTVSKELLDWLDDNPGRPFFAFLNYFEAHAPYLAPTKLRAEFRDRSNPPRGAYQAAIAALDQELISLLSRLKDRNALDNTIVIITSDHGELFGEHGIEGHANSVYQGVLQIPLVIRHPATVPMDLRISDQVSAADLAETIRRLAGLEVGGFPGASLSRFWDATVREKPHPTISSQTQAIRADSNERNAKGPLAALYSGQWHYFVNYDGREELYQIPEDPEELNNLATSPAFDSVRLRLRSEYLEATLGALPGRVPHPAGDR